METETRMREDPMMAFMRAEQDERSAIIKNPVKMKKLKENAKLLKELKKAAKAAKKSKKKSKKSKRKRDASSSDSESEEEKPAPKPVERKEEPRLTAPAMRVNSALANKYPLSQQHTV
jgi:outer membrane phospholipase A